MGRALLRQAKTRERGSMSGHYDVGMFVLFAVPLAVYRVRRVRLRNTFAVSMLAFLVGLASVFGRKP